MHVKNIDKQRTCICHRYSIHTIIKKVKKSTNSIILRTFAQYR